jgi:eukaryotic-like serine/threonine-protein kinase
VYPYGLTVEPTERSMSKNRANPNAQLEPGTVLVGRYLIVKRVGGGGMGNVYMARDKRLADALRAVKEMIEMFSDEGHRKKAVEDFERESQLLASLEHPSIPTIYDYFVHEGRYYLVMKFIGGGDLTGQLKQAPNGRLDERTVALWGAQTCDVLHYIHSQQPPIIYRDLKPANLMVDDKTNRIMLVDFGIARFVTPTQKGVTAIGTMGYAPPELFSGKVEPRSDLYSSICSPAQIRRTIRCSASILQRIRDRGRSIPISLLRWMQLLPRQ